MGVRRGLGVILALTSGALLVGCKKPEGEPVSAAAVPVAQMRAARGP